jgi:hypothetical protein
MRRPNATIMLLTAISVIAVDTVNANRLIGLVDSAAAQQPDLVPVDDKDKTPEQSENPVRYCQRTASGALVVRVRNDGDATTQSSYAITVIFSPGGPRSANVTSSHAPGDSNMLRITIPRTFPVGCFNPDCNFAIAVDSTEMIPERDEENNSVEGICIG